MGAEPFARGGAEGNRTPDLCSAIAPNAELSGAIRGKGAVKLRFAGPDTGGLRYQRDTKPRGALMDLDRGKVTDRRCEPLLANIGIDDDTLRMATKQKAPRPKRQHFVPRMHLKHFVGVSPKNMIWTYDTARENWRSSIVEKTTMQSNFYSAEDSEGNFNDDLEIALGEIETAAAPAYENLLQGNIPTGDRRAAFSMFVATLYLRTPAMVNAAARLSAELMQIELAHTLQSERAFKHLSRRMKEGGEGEIGDRQKLLDFVSDPNRYSLGISQKRGLSVLAGAEELAPLMYYRSWYIAEAIDGYFITSDHPVFKFVSPEYTSRQYGDGGFKNAKAEISIPLSPRFMLLMHGQDERASLIGPHLKLPSEFVTELNMMRAASADRYIYSPQRNPFLEEVALKHRENRAGVTVGYPGARPVVNIKR